MVCIFFVFVFVFLFVRVSLYSPDCPGTHHVNPASLKLSVSVSQVLELNVCTTTVFAAVAADASPPPFLHPLLKYLFI